MRRRCAGCRPQSALKAGVQVTLTAAEEQTGSQTVSERVEAFVATTLSPFIADPGVHPDAALLLLLVAVLPLLAAGCSCAPSHSHGVRDCVLT
jgi:hypothetical protein